ncbi:MAG: hypothetical protein LBJ16_01455 [Holosporaceae bacterium]|jgi:hypothetical protein|nr:hypothetical protein [Holosporaceae bacterium]
MIETNLMLGIEGLPPESARNCVQELFPIPNGEFKRSINGDLLFLESSEKKKYRSVISCRDVNSPLADKIWIGSRISVGCIQNLWQSIVPGEVKIQLLRPPVQDSVLAFNAAGDPERFILSDNALELLESSTEKIFVSFRPWLSMNVIDFSMETDEWAMTGCWKLTLEEF